MPMSKAEGTSTIQVATEPCTVDTDCPEGYVCQEGVCVPKPFNWLLILGLLGVVAAVGVTVAVAYKT